MNRAELITVASERSGVSKVNLEKSLDAILTTISAELAAGGEVRLAGFGLFSINKISARVGTNPKTGEPMNLPESRRVVFKGFKDLKEALNK